jgi:hypothetical protein
MMTPDAYADDPVFLERLVRPLLAREAATSYARQIPHRDAGWFESLLRDFNYPERSELRGRDDAVRYGSYTYFSSNSCAAYRNDALDEIGGILPGLVSEDYITVVRLLRRGHRIAYVADAVVRHSHHYTLQQEFGGTSTRATAAACISTCSRDHRRRARPCLRPAAARPRAARAACTVAVRRDDAGGEIGGLCDRANRSSAAGGDAGGTQRAGLLLGFGVPRRDRALPAARRLMRPSPKPSLTPAPVRGKKWCRTRAMGSSCREEDM